jgi:hypothetical protein
VVVGLDRWCSAEKYFWGESPPDWKRRTLPNGENIRVSTEHTVEFCKNSQVRVFDGTPMRRFWKVFNPDDVLPVFKPKEHAALMPGKPYTTTRPIFLHPQDQVGDGVILLTEPEARPHLLQKACQPVYTGDD